MNVGYIRCCGGSLLAAPSKLFILNLGYTRCCEQPARSAFQAFHRESWVCSLLRAACPQRLLMCSLFIANLGYTHCCGLPARSAFQAFHRESWVHSLLRAACPQSLPSFSSRILGTLAASGCFHRESWAHSLLRGGLPGGYTLYCWLPSRATAWRLPPELTAPTLFVNFGCPRCCGQVPCPRPRSRILGAHCCGQPRAAFQSRILGTLASFIQ